jgi:RNA polymerase sigma-70 factor, ECF subfamily
VSVEQRYIETRSEADFAALYNKYHNEIFYVVNKIVLKAEVSEEIVNDVFLKIRSCIDRYDSKYAFKTWLYTIAINEAKTSFNKEKKKKTTPTDFSSVETGGENISTSEMEARSAYFEYVSNDTEYDEEVDKKYVLLLDIINQLGEKYKDIMIDREVNKMSYEDLAKKYELNINTLRSRLKDGRNKVAKEFSKLKLDENVRSYR